ncbi:HNH endonuclease [Brevundimonas sp. 2R-24]|uniref:HNH endonuclease n=1 Tax=Peiella sedimenti TaxID=3061083 RepID=A0ABT8SN76_9CAUL|nr:HNH endonuclease [Caulobacteraceae bacterium XZ-24]
MTELTGHPWHVDHIVPLSRGGLHHQDNLIAMRADLNLAKGARYWPWLRWFNEPSDK